MLEIETVDMCSSGGKAEPPMPPLATGHDVVGGVESSRSPLHLSNLRGQFGYSRTGFDEEVEILAAGDRERVWTVEMPLDEGTQTFASVVERTAEFAEVLLRS